MIWSNFAIHLRAIGALLFVSTLSTSALSQEIQRPRRQVIPAEPIMRLEDLEAMALQRNPTLAQADAAIRAAQGRRKQAGLFPNPVAGYFLEEFAFRSPGQTAEQGAFIEQTIPRWQSHRRMDCRRVGPRR